MLCKTSTWTAMICFSSRKRSPQIHSCAQCRPSQYNAQHCSLQLLIKRELKDRPTSQLTCQHFPQLTRMPCTAMVVPYMSMGASPVAEEATNLRGITGSTLLFRMQFTPIQPQQPDQAAAEESPGEPATALQSQEALIRLQQKMQASSAAARPNPFLALQSKKASQQSDGTQANDGPASAQGACRPLFSPLACFQRILQGVGPPVRTHTEAPPNAAC